MTMDSPNCMTSTSNIWRISDFPPDACPVLSSPDFSVWEDYGGILAEDLIAMELLLGQLSAHVTRFHTELYAQDTMAELIEVIHNGIDGTTDQIAAAEIALSSIGCVVAVVSTVASQGAGMPAALAACTSMMGTIGGSVSADSMESLQLELDAALTNYRFLQNLMAIAFDIYMTTLSYDAAIASYDAHKAQFLNLQHTVQEDYRSLYENAFKVDPTNLLFSDEHISSMAMRFDAAMRDVRELSHFWLGMTQGLPSGRNEPFYIADGYYYLPRLAEITVSEHYSFGGSDAYLTLAGATRTDRRT